MAIIDLVGGDQLAEAHGTLVEGGTLVSVGRLAPDLSTVIGGPGRHDRSIVTFFLLSCTGLGPDLTWLANRVAAGDLRPQISWRAAGTEPHQRSARFLAVVCTARPSWTSPDTTNRSVPPRTQLRIAEHWPWASDLVTAFNRLAAPPRPVA